MKKSTFRKQLSYLKRKGYVFVTMSELLSVFKKRRKINKLVVVTFDDGFRNVIDNAYPIMMEFGAKGCFYLVSDLIGTEDLLWTDHIEIVIRNHRKENFRFIYQGDQINYHLGNDNSLQYAMQDIKNKLRMISDKERLEHLKQFSNIKLDDIPGEFAMASWQQITELNPDVLEIGSHTRRHPNCKNLASNEELEDEIFNSKVEIEKKTGYKIKHFCYPAGSYNGGVVAELMKCGYESAVTIMDGFNDEHSDLYRLKRIESNEQFLLFKASVSGCWDIMKAIKNSLARMLKGHFSIFIHL